MRTLPREGFPIGRETMMSLTVDLQSVDELRDAARRRSFNSGCYPPLSPACQFRTHSEYNEIMASITLNPAQRRVVQSSDLSRRSAAVFAAAEEAAVQVTRRDCETLVLTTKREAAVHEQILEVAAQLIAVSLDDRGTLGDRLARPFPWIMLLSVQDQRT